MKKLTKIASAVVFGAAISLNPVVSQAKLPLAVEGQALPSLAPMLEHTAPAVVSISVEGTQVTKQRVPDAFRYFFNAPREQVQERPFSSLGSGVIIDADEGYVVTNAHVVDQADDITISLSDGRQLKAKKIGQDSASDIALLQVDADDLVAVKIADSDKLRVGDFTVAIGNPFGLGQTVTSGIVSALGRTGLNIENYEDFIQTDAAINRGNSGGALVNLRGELIGINTAIIGPGGGNVGIGFAIPANMMQNLVAQLIEYGEVRRGALGIEGGNLTAELAKALGLEANQGAFVNKVLEDSAAEEAGLQAGDVITQVGGKNIRSFNELRAKVATLGAGKKVELGFIRDGDFDTATITLKHMDTGNVAAAQLHPALEGATLEGSKQGVRITNVEERSPAARIGLRKDDVIVGVNRVRVNSVSELRKRLDKADGVIALNLERDGRRQFLVIR